MRIRWFGPSLFLLMTVLGCRQTKAANQVMDDGSAGCFANPTASCKDVLVWSEEPPFFFDYIEEAQNPGSNPSGGKIELGTRVTLVEKGGKFSKVKLASGETKYTQNENLARDLRVCPGEAPLKEFRTGMKLGLFACNKGKWLLCDGSAEASRAGACDLQR